MVWMMDAELKDVAQYFSLVSTTLGKLDLEDVRRVANRILDAYRRRSTVFLFGNGGSAALASHHACDLVKGTIVEGRDRLAVIALTDNVPLITAWANDVSFDEIFVQQLRSLMRPGDVSFAISGSGNSRNVLKALEYSRETGAVTVGITGFEGGKMKTMCDSCVIVPSNNMQVIEDLHVSITHSIFTTVRYHIMQPHRARVAVSSS